MDVLVATPWFPNERGGWPAPFIADSALALASLGARVRVLVVRPWYPKWAEGHVGAMHRGEIQTADFPELDGLCRARHFFVPGNLARPLSNVLLDLAVSRALAGEISRRRPDVLHAHTENFAPAAARVSKKFGLPCAVTLHGRNTNSRYLSSLLQRRRFRRSLSEVERLVIVGEPLRALAQELSGRSGHVRLVPNGVAQSLPAQPRSFLKGSRLALIAVANLQEGKGLDLLIEALADLSREGVKGWTLAIIGEGPERGALQKQVQSSGLENSIKLLGLLPNKAVFEQLAKADCFILPSYREAFGVAYLEAMSMGLLTVGVEGQGPAQFIENGVTGFLVAPRDVRSLKTRLRAILEGDREALPAIAEAGRALVCQDYSWRAHAMALTEVFHEAIADNRPANPAPGRGDARSFAANTEVLADWRHFRLWRL